jgi:hypothetical protein
MVKVELSPVLRGTVYEPRVMRITRTAEDAFGFAEVPVVSFEDLFAGKMVLHWTGNIRVIFSTSKGCLSMRESPVT